MKKIKFSCSLDSTNLTRSGEYRIKIVAPFSELSKAVSLLSFLNSPFTIVVISQGERVEVKEVWLHKLDIDRFGESRVIFTMDYQMLGSTSVGFFGSCQNKPIVIGCKGGQDEEE